MPYYANSGPYPISKEGRGKVLYLNIEKFTITAPAPGSPYVQAFAIDIMASHQNQFYAYIEHASIYSNLGHKLVFSISDTPGNLRKIGSQNHHL